MASHNGDSFVYDSSVSVDIDPAVMVKKEWIEVLDENNGVYSSNQATINTSTLSNSNLYFNFGEAYLTLPINLCLTGKISPATAASSCDHAVGLKNLYTSLIHSFSVYFNNVQVCNSTPYSSIYNAFRIMTSMSLNDVRTLGSHIGFYPDNCASLAFNTSASVDGIGTCFNNNGGAFTVVDGAFSSKGITNDGFLRRQLACNYDPDGLTAPSSAPFSALLSATNCQTEYKSHIFNKINHTNNLDGVFQQTIMGVVYLKHLHSFFANLPSLVRGAFMKIQLNLANTSVQFSCDANGYMTTSDALVNSPLGAIQCGMVASKRTGAGGASAILADGTFRLSVSVGAVCLDTVQKNNAPGIIQSPLDTSIRLHCPGYTLAPNYEANLLSSPIKRCQYTDIYNYQVQNIPAGGQINALLTNSLAGIKSVLVLPVFTTAGNYGINPLFSPFDTAGTGTTSPLVSINNFNVVVSGQNMISPNSSKYGWEHFINHLHGCRSINHGLMDGLSSGLISREDFDMGQRFYYVDCSRSLALEKSVPKSIQIIGQNNSQREITLLCFVEYMPQELKINILNGSRVE